MLRARALSVVPGPLFWATTKKESHHRMCRGLAKPARSNPPQKTAITGREAQRTSSPAENADAGGQHAGQSTKTRILPLAIGGVAVYAAGLGLSLYYFRDSSCKSEHVSESERRKAYDHGAATYDQDVCSSEDWMGITPIRKELINKAKGRVLEVAAGTAVNLANNSYPSSCKVTCTDCSQGMVDVAKSRLQGRGHGQGGIDAEIEDITVMDADRMAFPDQHFDTVVDTFGLCSFEDPSATLREMRRVCKIGGRVLLLEHGRSYLPPVNYVLDWSSHKHAARWGCYWNRDILGIVESSGFRVLEQQRKHLGTTYMFVLERVS